MTQQQIFYMVHPRAYSDDEINMVSKIEISGIPWL
jgi:hypothetical protein